MKDIVGHEAIKRLLPYIEKIDIPVLFLGSAGTGKRTYAEWLCRDLHHLSKRVLINPSIDDVRDVVAWASKKSIMKQPKVAIIELTTSSLEAQNALLKLIEEPPRNFKLLLLSAVTPLPTIRSRCLRYRFDGLTREQLLEVLRREGYGLAEAQVAVDYADGSVSRAISYMEKEETVFEVDSMLRIGSPADAAERLIRFKKLDDQHIFYDELARSANMTNRMLAILSRPGGFRGKALLALMLRPKGPS